jgi:hypothetical protein
MIKSKEQRIDQEFVSHCRIESIADAVLHRFARGDDVPRDAGIAHRAPDRFLDQRQYREDTGGEGEGGVG